MFPNLIRSRENLLYLLAAAVPFSFVAWSALLNNFVVEVAKFDGEKIGMLQSKLSISESSTEKNKIKRQTELTNILHEMNSFYKEIDPNGNLVFESLFTKKDEVFSGSEATIFHIVNRLEISFQLS